MGGGGRGVLPHRGFTTSKILPGSCAFSCTKFALFRVSRNPQKIFFRFEQIVSNLDFICIRCKTNEYAHSNSFINFDASHFVVSLSLTFNRTLHHSRNLFFLIILPLIQGVFLCLTLSPLFRPSCFPARVCAEKNWFTPVKRSRGPLPFYLHINVKASANHCVSVYVLVNPCVTFSNPFRGFVSTIKKYGGHISSCTVMGIHRKG